MPETRLKKVISASRRIDLVGCYPDETAMILAKKCPPEKVHTLVIWTKNATHLLGHSRLIQQLRRYDQLFLHFTVTGMGNSPLEPYVPAPEESLKALPALIQLVGHPDRIRIRFDPIVHLRKPSGKYYTNFFYFNNLVPIITAQGITNVSISWMSVYKKVKLRLARNGFQIVPLSPPQQQRELAILQETTEKWGVVLHFCSTAGLPVSRCIDGTLLSKLHPTGESCSENKAKGQRQLCGCTESWDIGWYHPCLHGCLYCYGNPKEYSK